ncbi:DUF2075 domain-containing protein [Sandaracinobacteroides saxicola]|uniref:DUF2075 domain-containing protein n=2 Tax=Sandaracinobacteroides saxicola TaxID=2759707 RepID=A0A7G5IM78_9SPHN|nr:DUF2075 domain-containing protein [Sandaracinobacteroides saxicola]
MGRRADAVLVWRGIVFVVEYKVGEVAATLAGRAQVHGYALDLKNFHETSQAVPIVPLLLPTACARAQFEMPMLAPDGVAEPVVCAPGDMAGVMQAFADAVAAPALDATRWAAGRYRPTPTIIEAAQALFAGHRVEEISRSEAGAENLTVTADAVDAVIARARTQREKAIIFVTGVPGAGKTLAGLNIACRHLDGRAGEDATYLSGNGPLVDVLREALRRDLRAQRAGARVAGRDGFVAARSPDKFIQNVHHFRDDYAGNGDVPSDHVVIFDEAQRAWDRDQTSAFMRRKRGLVDFDQSEPAFLLSVMDRHPDWCVVVALIGDGQEINTGEAGVAEWMAALAGPFRHWRVHVPPRLLSAGHGVSKELAFQVGRLATGTDPALHLAVSVRSFRSEQVAAFVAAMLGDDAAAAREARPDPARFPIWRTRDLAVARAWVRDRRRAGERAGLLAHSKALRLKPEGVFVKAKVDPPVWFLNEGWDVRASDALEDAATEFDVQGLELDWAVVAWDANLTRVDDQWLHREFRGARWTQVGQAHARQFLVNAYRVLLTRARQGMVIFVPRGEERDVTRAPAGYDAIDGWLAACGVGLVGERL